MSPLLLGCSEMVLERPRHQCEQKTANMEKHQCLYCFSMNIFGIYGLCIFCCSCERLVLDKWLFWSAATTHTKRKRVSEDNSAGFVVQDVCIVMYPRKEKNEGKRSQRLGVSSFETSARRATISNRFRN